MKIIVQISERDLVNAKMEHLNRILRAAQEIAVDTKEAEELSLGATVKATAAETKEGVAKAEPEVVKQEPAVSNVTYRAVLDKFKDLAEAGKAKEIQAILQKHGIAKLGAIPNELLADILREAESIK